MQGFHSFSSAIYNSTFDAAIVLLSIFSRDKDEFTKYDPEFIYLIPIECREKNKDIIVDGPLKDFCIEATNSILKSILSLEETKLNPKVRYDNSVTYFI